MAVSFLRFLPVCEVARRVHVGFEGVKVSEKRSERGENAQADLFGLGVGARQGGPQPPMAGGEYLNDCTLPNFSTFEHAPGAEKKRSDPRFCELEKIGIPGVWLRIAERVGFDTFLDLWRMLSEDDRVRHDGGARLPKLRCYSAYSRYQRNQYIRSLAAQGTPPNLIQEALRRQLNECLHLTNIIRIANKAKIEK
ncbi:MAG: hypothetical protein IPG16_02260 [Comamonadaceae bacterium]|nr:hypothetical protein [Comamonadaceae bacterium]